MNVVDPRELSDRELFAYLLLGDLPRRGWPGRGRAIAARMLELAAITVATIIVLAGLAVGFTVLWAAALPKPA